MASRFVARASAGVDACPHSLRFHASERGSFATPVAQDASNSTRAKARPTLAKATEAVGKDGHIQQRGHGHVTNLHPQKVRAKPRLWRVAASSLNSTIRSCVRKEPSCLKMPERTRSQARYVESRSTQSSHTRLRLFVRRRPKSARRSPFSELKVPYVR